MLGLHLKDISHNFGVRLLLAPEATSSLVTVQLLFPSDLQLVIIHGMINVEVAEFESDDDDSAGKELQPHKPQLEHDSKDVVQVRNHVQTELTLERHEREVTQNHQVGQQLAPTGEIVETHHEHQVGDDDA